MTLKSIAKQLSDYSEKLEEGSLSPDEILKLTNLARDFYERMIVLRYKTVEESVHNEKEAVKASEQAEAEVPQQQNTDSAVKPKKESKPSEEPESEPETREESTTDEKQNTASQQKVEEEAAEFNAVTAPSNQISLIDSIEEIKQMEQSLNDALRHDSPSLAQKLHLKPISDLRSAITVNQKFQFISELFDNDAEAFESAVKRLNSCATFIEADEYIQNTLKDEFGWEMKSPTVREMIHLVERRFL